MGFTTIPPAGAMLRGSVLDALIHEARPISAIVTSNQPLAINSTTMQDITQLTISLPNTSTYIIDLNLVVSASAGTAEDISIAVVHSGTCNVIGSVGGTTGGVSGAATTDVNIGAPNVASGTACAFFGVSTNQTAAWLRFILAQASGTFSVKAAQGVSGGNTISVVSGSTLSARIVS